MIITIIIIISNVIRKHSPAAAAAATVYIFRKWESTWKKSGEEKRGAKNRLSFLTL